MYSPPSTGFSCVPLILVSVRTSADAYDLGQKVGILIKKAWFLNPGDYVLGRCR